MFVELVLEVPLLVLGGEWGVLLLLLPVRGVRREKRKRVLLENVRLCIPFLGRMLMICLSSFVDFFFFFFFLFFFLIIIITTIIIINDDDDDDDDDYSLILFSSNHAFLPISPFISPFLSLLLSLPLPPSPSLSPFRPGDIINILDKDDPSGWWKGSLNGKVGMIPTNFVELLE